MMHMTYSEIKSQYKALNHSMDCVNTAACDVKKLFEKSRPRLVAFLGCGASRCIADALMIAAQKNLNISATSIPAGDYMLHPVAYAPILSGSFVIVLSRSGSTSEVVEAVKGAKEMGVPVVSITCVAGSPLAALADIAVEMPWCADSSVCQTRTASCLYAAGMLMLARLSDNAALREGLERAVAFGPSFLEWYEEELKFTASKAWKSVVLLADAELAGVAEEAALAFGEICRRPAVSSHMLEYRHGPITLAGRDTLVIVGISDGNQYELDLVADVAKRDVELLVYSDIPLDGLPERSLNVSFGKSLPHAARGLPFLLIAQLIAYHRAVYDGVDPDRPDGLSITVKL